MPEVSGPDPAPGRPVVAGPRPRAVIEAVPGYRAGRRPTPRPGLRTYKSSSNENPYAPLPAIVDAVAEAATRLNRYPDPASAEMVAALAQRHGVTPDEIATGTGSVGILGQIVQAMVDADDEVVYAWRSFEAYPIVTAVAGGRSVRVPLVDERHDLPAMADAVGERTRVVFLCTPNNPTGTVIRQDEFDAFMARVPDDVLVVVDEAYVQFVTDDRALDGMRAYRDHPNVAVLRSFAKAFGLAGMRVGMCIARPDIVSALLTTAVPFGVSEMAQAAVLASLRHEAELDVRVQAIIEQRDRVVASVRALGFPVADPQANFVWVRTADAADIAAICEEEGVVVRPFLEGDPQGPGLRVTVGEPEADEVVVRVLERFSPSR